MSAVSRNGKIYQAFARHCSSYELEGAWSRFEAPEFIRKLPPDPAAVLEAMLQEFSAADLCQAGLATVDENAKLSVNPVLQDSSAPILVLRSQPEALPLDLLTDTGCFSGQTLPIFAVLDDMHFRCENAQSSDTLCVAFSTREAAALLSLGIPTTLATGLERISRQHLVSLSERLALQRSSCANEAVASASAPPQARGAEHAQRASQMLFLGWDLLTLRDGEPNGLAQVRTHFTGLQQYLGIDMEDVGVWHPGAEAVEGVRFCVNHTTKDECGEALLKIMADTAEPLVPLSQRDQDRADSEEQVIPSTELVTAWNAWYDDPGKNVEATMSAWTTFDKALRAHLSEPLLQEASKERDPMRRNMLAAAASLSHSLQRNIASGHAMFAPGSDGVPKANASVRAAEMKQILAVSKEFVSLAQELVSCKKNQVPAKKSYRLR
jgi:hypothetical protein